MMSTAKRRCPQLPSTGKVTTGLLFLMMTMYTQVEGFSKGAPLSTCLTMFPKHGPAERQPEGAPPYKVVLSPTTYRPGQVITVELRSSDGRRPIKGLLVKATRRALDAESALGTFVKHPAHLTQLFTCEGGYKNMVTHSADLAGANRAGTLETITLQWKAPDSNVGDIVFVATFVENYTVFWTSVKTKLTAENQLTVQPPTEQLSPVTVGNTDSLDLSSCGSDRGCFLYPRYCSASDCQAAVSFRQDGDHFRFEMMARDSTYVAVGFSEDTKMGQDETVICTADDEEDTLSVQHGFNPGLFNQRIVRRQLSNLTVSRTEGLVTCSFKRPRVTVTRSAKQSAPDLQYITSTYDLNQDYYLFLAWGTVKLGSDVINKHKELPPVTDSKVSFQRYEVHRGSALPFATRIHASLMAVAWVFAAGLTTAMSRYYKHWLADRQFCGTGIWFQIHRAAGVTAATLTAASAILIFVIVGGFAEKEKKHAIVGLTVLCLVTLQVLGGMLRPDKTSAVRPLFKWGHTLLGHSAHILSAAAMYLAFDIRYIPKMMRDFGVAVLTGWVPIQIAWIIVLELRRCCTVDEASTRRPSTDKQPWRQALKTADSLLLFAYCLTLLLLGAAILSAINVF